MSGRFSLVSLCSSRMLLSERAKEKDAYLCGVRCQELNESGR